MLKFAVGDEVVLTKDICEFKAGTCAVIEEVSDGTTLDYLLSIKIYVNEDEVRQISKLDKVLK